MTPTTTTQTITPPTIISVPGVTTVEETIDLSFFPSTTTTIVPPTIISVPGVTTVYETVDLGVTNQPRGTGRSLPVQPTAFVAVIKRT
ncbi:hypothetical protein B0H65DRAFT_467264 [Neurospora tetraspora]|uniref:Uncharacterized protein n=1 Tax=Neurospora tetraspora TaxID=94610 RepID=A0AAE0JFZ1_9PEZI|nr:hypothetical protein B0H65DRAFT_467264 [Neurospora tetraspora]